jgi:hypothetical protein
LTENIAPLIKRAIKDTGDNLIAATGSHRQFYAEVCAGNEFPASKNYLF